MPHRLVMLWRPVRAGGVTRLTGRAGQKRKVVRGFEKQKLHPSLNSADSAPVATPENALVAGPAVLLPARSSGCRHQACTGPSDPFRVRLPAIDIRLMKLAALQPWFWGWTSSPQGPHEGPKSDGHARMKWTIWQRSRLTPTKSGRLVISCSADRHHHRRSNRVPCERSELCRATARE